MKLRFVSDLHLEINGTVPEFIQGVEGEGIVFLGDTTLSDYLRPSRTDSLARKGRQLFDQLLEQAKGFDQVYFVMGNHEHYKGIFDDSAEWYRKHLYETKKLSPDKFRVLDNNMFFLNDSTIIVGATLWTDMGGNNKDSHWFVGRGMNDFHIIYRREYQNFTTYMARDEHLKTLDYMRAVFEEFKGKRFVVATHHAPSYKSNGEGYKDSQIIDGYCSDLENFVQSYPGITDWLHGHTHVNVDYNIGGCRVQTNQRGYVGYDRVEGHVFDAKSFADRFIEV